MNLPNPFFNMFLISHRSKCINAPFIFYHHGRLAYYCYNCCGSFLILIDDSFAMQHESIMEAATLDFSQNYNRHPRPLLHTVPSREGVCSHPARGDVSTAMCPHDKGNHGLFVCIYIEQSVYIAGKWMMRHRVRALLSH